MASIRDFITIKTDQLNSEDFRPGEARTVTITRIQPTGNKDQPLAFHYTGFKGLPWKPCKTMMSVMEGVWGEEMDNYIGHSLTLICDPKVRYGKHEVGGVRITHMSHINSATSVMVTVTRGNKQPYPVKPLRVVPGVAITPEASREMLEAAAADGSDALKDAWTSLPAATRKQVSPTGCPPELKTIAEGIDADRAAALAAKSDLADALAGDNGADKSIIDRMEQ